MATYVGEGLTIVCAAKDPTTQQVISTATAEVEFYAPPKNPARIPDDRVRDNGPYAMTFDAEIDGGSYVAFVDTTGWAPGKWVFKVTLSGAYQSWEYGTVRLSA